MTSILFDELCSVHFNLTGETVLKVFEKLAHFNALNENGHFSSDIYNSKTMDARYIKNGWVILGNYDAINENKMLHDRITDVFSRCVIESKNGATLGTSGTSIPLASLCSLDWINGLSSISSLLLGNLPKEYISNGYTYLIKLKQGGEIRDCFVHLISIDIFNNEDGDSRQNLFFMTIEDLKSYNHTIESLDYKPTFPKGDNVNYQYEHLCGADYTSLNIPNVFKKIAASITGFDGITYMTYMFDNYKEAFSRSPISPICFTVGKVHSRSFLKERLLKSF